MRTETTTRDLYQLDELDEATQAKAIDNYRELRAHWWDEFDSDQIAETIVYTLAEKLRAPGWDTFGPGDFPGITGLTLAAWDVERRSIEVGGYLTPESAPGLPWPRRAVRLDLEDPNTGGRTLAMEDDTSAYTVYPSEAATVTVPIFDALDEALRDAIHAGAADYEHMFSEEYLREDIEDNEREFLSDGRVA